MGRNITSWGGCVDARRALLLVLMLLLLLLLLLLAADGASVPFLFAYGLGLQHIGTEQVRSNVQGC